MFLETISLIFHFPLVNQKFSTQASYYYVSAKGKIMGLAEWEAGAPGVLFENTPVYSHQRTKSNRDLWEVKIL